MRKRTSLLGYFKRKFNQINQTSLTVGSDISKVKALENVNLVGKIVCEEGVSIVHGVTISSASSVHIGAHTIINGPNTDIMAKVNDVNIGKYCSIARNVSIQEYNHTYKGISTYFVNKHIIKSGDRAESIYSKGAVNIGHDVWVGAASIILSGVTIGHGAIIAANSVVAKDVPPYSIVGGSPAKIISYRFDEEVIARLLELQWWYWDQETMEANEALFLTKELTIELLNSLH